MKSSLDISTGNRWGSFPRGVFPSAVVYAAADRRRGARRELARRLLRRLPGFGMRPVAEFEIRHDELGRPLLIIDGASGPAISFSYLGDCVWAAAWGRDGGLGIDSAASREFTNGYPLHRILSPKELSYALRVADRVSEAAALIWTLKESSVKALGTGFRHHDPKDVVCGAPRREKNGYVFPVEAGHRLSAWTHRVGDEWISIAVDRRRSRPPFDPATEMA